jgi:hypothetical protein
MGRFIYIVKLKRQDVIYESSPSSHLKIIFKRDKNDQMKEKLLPNQVVSPVQ